MTSFRIRPRIKQISPLKSEEIQTRIHQAVANSKGMCTTSVIPGYITLRVRPEDRHFWSPQLNLTFEETEEGETIIRGLYGPNPQVWTMIFFGYATLGVAFFFILMYGMTQVTLGKEALILWILPVIAVLALVLYLISQFGQKLGVEQTFILHHVFEEAMGEHVRIK
ncbi:MAG: hypothetical protein CMO01_13465 [Thalassobius sp.]|nr:hypothetical protein [Thalassovita sp.]